MVTDEILNEYFCSVYLKEDDFLPQFQIRTNETDEELVITRNQVINKMENLDTDKTGGNDMVLAYVMNKCSQSLSIPLTRIYQKSMKESTIPYHWKQANITALPKSGSRLEPSNYRPVSLTSIPCKIMESIIRDQIMNHLVKHNLLNDSQHGFVKSKSCVTNLLEALDFLTQAIADGKSVDVLYTDFAKAFATVAHTK